MGFSERADYRARMQHLRKPDEFDVGDADAELSCWACYRGGFDIPTASIGKE